MIELGTVRHLTPLMTAAAQSTATLLGLYSAMNGVIDEWMGQMGQAFIQADHKGVPGGIYRATRKIPMVSIGRRCPCTFNSPWSRGSRRNAQELPNTDAVSPSLSERQ
jgi:hypothetical protein